MQKWERILLINIFILSIIGGFIGFAMTMFGIGQVKVLYNIDIFGLFELILLLIVIVCIIFDIYDIYESKNQFSTTKFKLMINRRNRNRLRNILILLALISLFEFGVFLYSTDMHIIPLFFITLILTLMFVLHNRVDNGIGENGILHFGIFHSWIDIKSHNIGNETLLEMNVVNNFFCFEYNNIVKFDFDKKDKDDIEKFLAEKLMHLRH